LASWIVLCAEDAKTLLGKALQEIQLNRWEPATDALEHAIRLDPALALAHFDLGVCYFAQGRFDNARRAFNDARRLNPDHRFTSYYLARLDLLDGNLDRAIHGLSTLACTQPVADELYYLGSAYFRKGEIPSAMQSLEKAIASKPEDYRAHFLLARVYRSAGKEREAAQQFAASEQFRDADHQKARDILACHNAFDEGSQQRALQRCRELLDGTDPTKLVSLGMALAERQLYDLALPPFSKAARLDPENFEPHYNLGLTYFKMRNYAGGRPALEAAAGLRPEFFDAVAVLGTTLFALGDDYGAATYLRHAHELKPGNEKIKTLLFEQLKVIAQHLASSRDYAQARPFLEEALRLKPDAADLHFTFAQVAAALGDGAKAERERALGESYSRRP